MSRAFGDYTLKKDKSLKAEEQKVSCVPDIVRTTMRPNDLLYLSCDGLFEHLENADVVECVQKNYDLVSGLSGLTDVSYAPSLVCTFERFELW